LYSPSLSKARQTLTQDTITRLADIDSLRDAGLGYYSYDGVRFMFKCVALPNVEVKSPMEEATVSIADNLSLSAVCEFDNSGITLNLRKVFERANHDLPRTDFPWTWPGVELAAVVAERPAPAAGPAPGLPHAAPAAPAAPASSLQQRIQDNISGNGRAKRPRVPQ
jgi:hypothetical protein